MSESKQDLQKTKRPRAGLKNSLPRSASLDEREREGRLVAASFSAFSGPLPPPEILTRYNQAFPGCAEAIVGMAQRQSEHRQSLEKLVVTSNIKNETRGQYLAFLISTLVISVGGVLLWNDKDPQGLTLILGDLVLLAGLFIYGRQSKKKELKQKREEQDEAAAGS